MARLRERSSGEWRSRIASIVSLCFLYENLLFFPKRNHLIHVSYLRGRSAWSFSTDVCLRRRNRYRFNDLLTCSFPPPLPPDPLLPLLPLPACQIYPTFSTLLFLLLLPPIYLEHWSSLGSRLASSTPTHHARLSLSALFPALPFPSPHPPSPPRSPHSARVFVRSLLPRKHARTALRLLPGPSALPRGRQYDLHACRGLVSRPSR